MMITQYFISLGACHAYIVC